MESKELITNVLYDRCQIDGGERNEESGRLGQNKYANAGD